MKSRKTHVRPARKARNGVRRSTCVQRGASRQRQRRGKRGQTNSRHGYWRKPTYRSWENMLKRCYNENSISYKYYGAKGIRVCARWMESFVNFLADMGVRRKGTSIDRIDPCGNYEPQNCRWATARQQQRNRRASHKDETNEWVAVMEAVWKLQGKAW